jgi:hypothetical protein
MKKRKTAANQIDLKELIRRRDEIRTGKVKPVPAAIVFRRIKRLLDK